MKRFGVVVAALLASTSANAAVPIAGLCNTGRDASCSGPGTLGAQDQNWVMSSPEDGVAYDGDPVHPNWIQNDSTSYWLTPTAVGDASLDPSSDGLYSYTLAFSLAGFNPATASFAGRFAVDNAVDSIVLNGLTLGASGGTFNAWTAFGASTGFVDGLNTLTFNTRNFGQPSGNPAGLRVEFDSSSVTAVPEPATWALMLIGFGAVGATLRRRRQKVTVSYA